MQLVDNKQYEIGPLANATFSEGLIYSMYMCRDKVYTSRNDAQAAVDNAGLSMPFRVAAGLAFISIIALVYLVAAYIQTSKKSNCK